MAVHQRSLSNLTELERICKEEWQSIPKSRCEKLVAWFPRRPMAVLAQKCASTQYWAQGLYTYACIQTDHAISGLSVFFLSRWGAERTLRNKMNFFLGNGCNKTKSEKFNGVWVLTVPTVSIKLRGKVQSYMIMIYICKNCLKLLFILLLYYLYYFYNNISLFSNNSK